MQLAQGLLHLHNLNIVHCDLKTDNVVRFAYLFPCHNSFWKEPAMK